LSRPSKKLKKKRGKKYLKKLRWQLMRRLEQMQELCKNKRKKKRLNKQKFLKNRESQPLRKKQKPMRLRFNDWLNYKQSRSKLKLRSTLNWQTVPTKRRNRPRQLKLHRKKLIKWPKNVPSKNWKNKTKILLKTICLMTNSLK
jgi:hypothetical protein